MNTLERLILIEVLPKVWVGYANDGGYLRNGRELEALERVIAWQYLELCGANAEHAIAMAGRRAS